MRTIAHLSDLHFGATDPAVVAALPDALARLEPHVVCVSGDLTQRARHDQFRRARVFLESLPMPQIVVPGNHDVPLYNVFSRFFRPLSAFRRHISAEAYPCFEDDEVIVVGADTTRSFTIKDGGLGAADVRQLSDVLQAAPAETARVVVCHHPFDAPSGRIGRWTSPRPDRDAINTLVSSGADILLTGHLHLTYVGHTALRYQTGARSAIVVEAGTSTSVRGRGEANSFNLLHIDRDRVTVERLEWDGRGFVPAAQDEFLREPNGWTPRAQRA